MLCSFDVALRKLPHPDSLPFSSSEHLVTLVDRYDASTYDSLSFNVTSFPSS